MPGPKVFISYSHDSEPHKDWVRHLAEDLRAASVDASLDQWDLGPGQDLATFMQHGITDSDRVLLICTESYVRKAEAGSGGVGFERLIVTAELVQQIDTRKFVPLVRNNPHEPKVPRFLGPRLHIDFSKDEDYNARLEALLRELLGVPRHTKPPLGPNPFSGTPAPAEIPARNIGPTGLAPEGRALLDEDWFKTQAATAIEGLTRTGLQGHMELRFGLHQGISKSQIELLNAVKSAEIRTFGWPIGVVLENRDEFRPKPYEDGIRSEVAIKGESVTGRVSYDYWSARATGDFYLLQSLFEDQRGEKELFFNTRIVRVTESLLFASKLYTALGVPPDTYLSLRITHRGLTGRRLSTSNPNRVLMAEVTAAEHQSQVQIVSPLSEIPAHLTAHVKKIVAPLFMLFDFTEFADAVYDDIVSRFVHGEVT